MVISHGRIILEYFQENWIFYFSSEDNIRYF
jgi:hypothetical protein